MSISIIFFPQLLLGFPDLQDLRGRKASSQSQRESREIHERPCLTRLTAFQSLAWNEGNLPPGNQNLPPAIALRLQIQRNTWEMSS